MSFRNTAILALLVALLGAYVYWVERPAIEREGRTARLLDVDPEEITRFELQTPTETIRAERTGEGWALTEPIEGPADARAVDTILRTAAEAEQKRTVGDGSNLASFGLQEPDATLRLFAGERALPALRIGKGTPIGFNAYARSGEDGEVVLTGGTVRAALMKQLADLRDKTILQVSENDVSGLTVTPRDGDPVRLERTPDGWRLTAPIEAPAAQTAVTNLVASLRALRAVEFATDRGEAAENRRGLTPPALEIAIETRTNPPVVLRIGDEVDLGDKALVAAAIRGDDQIYYVATHVPGSLGKSAADLRDKTLLPVPTDDIAQLRVRHADGESFALVRNGETWAFAAEDADPVEPLVAQRFADDVLALEGDEILSADTTIETVGLDAPDIEITAIDAGGTEIGTLVARRSTGDDAPAYHAAARDGGPVYTLRDYVFTRIAKRRADLEAGGPGAVSP